MTMNTGTVYFFTLLINHYLECISSMDEEKLTVEQTLWLWQQPPVSHAYITSLLH